MSLNSNWGNLLRGAYNRDIVIPPIIQKLRQLGYIEEYENDEISLTPLGRKNCGKQVVVDEII
jgi:hypothetical protein